MARRSNNGRSGAIAKQTQRNYVPSWHEEFAWTDEFGDALVHDDPVNVKSEFGNYVFRGVHVKEEVVISVHCYGGPSGNTCNRFFAPERVTKVTTKRKRRRAVKSEAKE